MERSERRWRRGWLTGLASGVVVLGGAALWLGLKAEPELPVFSCLEGDLPPLPEKNGWDLLDIPAFQNASDFEGIDVQVLDDARSVDERWAALLENRDEIAGRSGSPSAKALLAAWDQAAAAEAFADACPLDRTGCHQSQFAFFGLHSRALARAARLAADGDTDDAEAKLSRQIRLLTRYRASSRSLFSAAFSSTALAQSLSLAHLLTAHAPERTGPGRRALVEAVDAINNEDATFRQPVTGEYLARRNMLLSAERGEVPLTEGWPPRFTYDRVRTHEVLAEIHGCGILPRLEGEDPGSWTTWERWTNPIGVEFANPEVLGALIENQREAYDDESETIERRRQRILEVCRAGTGARNRD